MSSTLTRLRKLHDVDLEIYKLDRALADLPRRRKDHEARLEQVRARLESKKKDLMERTAQADRLELDLKSKEGEIGKMQVQLNGVKTNADYQTLTTKIASVQADNEKLEERILEIMGGLEELRTERREREAALRTSEAEFKTAVDRLDKEAAELRSRLEEKRRLRDQAVVDVPADAIATYERIHKRTTGSAMAPVKDQVCQECHMSLTTHDITKILSGDQLVVCRTCSHILYIDGR